jgi:carbonic anhydrase/acetyltransferase-like protein (isoleucine patch superfamily)
MSLSAYIRILVYFLLTGIVLIVSFFPEGWLLYYLVTTPQLDVIHYLLSPVYLFFAYCVTVLFFGVVHSQIVVRLTLPFLIKPGKYPHHTTMGRLIAVRITADGIFKSMIKVFTFLPFIWGIFLFPYGLRLYGLRCGKNVHIATRTYVETAGLVEIGDNSFIGYNSVVTGHANEDRSIVVEPTKIGKNALVGTYSIVACGCEFGDGSTLGGMSGMLKGQKIPPNEVWIGVPAKFLRKRGEKSSNTKTE